MSPDKELSALLNTGRELYDHIKSFKDCLFSSYAEFQKFFLPLNEKIGVLHTHLDSLLRRYPNNDENAVLIVILGQFRNDLKQLESSCKADIVYSHQFFKQPTSLRNAKQIDGSLDSFAGSLNTLANLGYPSRSLSYPPTA